MQSIKSKLKQIRGRLISITCLQEGKVFTLVYHIDKAGKVLTFKVSNKGIFESVSDLFPTAEIYEREAHDLFGVKFDNPTSHEVFLLPERWRKKPPMRE